MHSQTIVVVGASRGIGKELVLKLSESKTNRIIALSRDIERMKLAFQGLNNVAAYAYDLSGSCREDAEQLFEQLDSIDILVNNSGKLVNKPFLSLTQEDLQSCYATNIVGVMQTVQAAVPKMKKNGGHIVNISSMGGVQGSVKFAGLSAYSTSKAALCSFTELFAEEYKASKIKMNCLCLGAVQTEMLAEAFPGYEAPVSAEQMATYIADFALTGHHFFNGKILPVSLSTP
jgi:3-oxoacyl-[acyl-carrier protein] reductase